jgi:hypothetical protein
MFRVVPLPIIRISLTLHLALVYVIRFEVSLHAGPGCSYPKHIEVHFLAEMNLEN